MSEDRYRRFLDTLGPGAMLAPLIEAALISRGHAAWPSEYPIRVDNSEHLWDGYFHPSSHASLGAMRLYHLFHPEVRKVLEFERHSPGDVMTLQVGSAMHAMIQSILVTSGLVDEDEVEFHFVNEDHWCSGTIDARRLSLPNGEAPMLEIKSAARLPREPIPRHVDQMQVYMDAGCGGIEYGILLYVEKSFPHRFAEFRVDRDERLIGHIYEKWTSVLEAVELNDPSTLGFCAGCEPQGKVWAACEARKICAINWVTK